MNFVLYFWVSTSMRFLASWFGWIFFCVLCKIKSSLSFVLAMYLIWTGDWLILCASLAYSIRISWWSKHAVRMIAASNMNRIRVLSTGTNWFTFVGYSLGVTQSFRTVFAVAIAIANSRCGCPTDFQAYFIYCDLCFSSNDFD